MSYELDKVKLQAYEGQQGLLRIIVQLQAELDKERESAKWKTRMYEDRIKSLENAICREAEKSKGAEDDKV